MVREQNVSPIGEALGWASRAMAIGLAMFLPGVGGSWLDARFGTTFLGPVGFVVGFATTLFWLVQLTRHKERGRR